MGPAGACSDRIGRASRLIAIDGLFIRAWTRDGLLADLDADPRMTDILARVPAKFHLAGLGTSATRAVSTRDDAWPPHDGPVLQQGDPRQSRARAAEEDHRLQGDGEAARRSGSGAAGPLLRRFSFNPLLVMWVLPMIAERKGDPLAFVESTIRGDVGYDSPEWIEAFQTIADLRTSGALLAGRVRRITRRCSNSCCRERRR